MRAEAIQLSFRTPSQLSFEPTQHLYQDYSHIFPLIFIVLSNATFFVMLFCYSTPHYQIHSSLLVTSIASKDERAHAGPMPNYALALEHNPITVYEARMFYR